MTRIILIGGGSGLVSALLFASVASGSPLAVLLFYLAPLPVFIVSLGWLHWSGLLASVVGGAALSLAISGPLGLVFLVGVGLPAWWLSYLTLLATPDAKGGADWYPVGRLVLWAATLGALLTAFSLPAFVGGFAGYEAGFRAALEQVLRAQLDTPDGMPIELPNGGDPARFIDLLALLLPPTAALSSMLAALVNLWAGARIVRRSGRLPRPWPDIAGSIAYPRGTAIGLALLALASLLPGLFGLVAELASVTLVAAFALLGLAVLHVITRGLGARPFALAAVYLLILLQAWLIFAAALLGLAEHFAGVRARFAARRSAKPPILPPT